MNNTWKIYLLAFITFMTATSEFIIAGILDKVAASAHISVSSAGQLITVFAIANAIGTPVVMMAMARMDRRKLLMLSLVVIALGSVLTVVLPGFGFLIFSRVLLAIGSGVFATIAKTLASRLASPERRAGAIATVITGASAALIAGVPIGRVVAAAYDWRVIFWGIGILSLLAIFTVARMIPATIGEEAVPLGKQLALLKNPKIVIGLGVIFFWQLGYAVLFSYIAPFLLTVSRMSEREVSIALFAFGIATLVGSKFGGFLTDRIGIPRTLVGGMVVHVIALVLLSTIAGSTFVTIPLLMLWAFSAWSSGPGMQYNLVLLAPEASGIMLSLYGSILQLSIAAAAGIGGIAVRNASMLAVSWTGAASVAVAVCIAAASFSLARSSHNSIAMK
ncbi:MFS transporter, DHA1 family, purine base/nucleoside efflux pump [Paenibacillus sophorae]|uniref:MFS transporter n=1 Tax=Paenibacillus sophorae TaxID=1333845 RepID=A0A1H8SH97_9BACL|nr:MFS transporter [Paenibacillus sophorae]QWU16719.1 MFS transporter [Paenibacillus sophorae]SEO77563.1 MFS transporter, DHA1 family, purine base/nucleoside efflux pump [Paenibacillus sophorae]